MLAFSHHSPPPPQSLSFFSKTLRDLYGRLIRDVCLLRQLPYRQGTEKSHVGTIHVQVLPGRPVQRSGSPENPQLVASRGRLLSFLWCFG